MKKILISFVVIVCTLCMYVNVGQAAEPEDTHTIAVTICDVTTVTEQLGEYETEIDMLAKLMWNECRGVKKPAERASVVWTVLNRVDHEKFPDTISAVIKQRSQFAYNDNPKICGEKNKELFEELREIAKDVVMRWLFEKQGIEDVGRVLPVDYIFFAGHDGHNWFRKKGSRRYWKFTLPDPYEEVE